VIAFGVTQPQKIIEKEKEYGWQSYPQKHFKSRFTKFYEGYWLPKKFGYDTRKVQYLSLILTNIFIMRTNNV
jgi:hypothetical protein